MPYLRLTADRRGFENTFLVHVAAPGEPARVLYWYRTAPGLRIGRPALDDSAMRTLEEQYPDIDFDWPYILDMGAMTPVEVEAPVPPRKRKPRRDDGGADTGGAGPMEPVARTTADGATALGSEEGEAAPLPSSAPEPADTDLLSDLLGRGIASSLRLRHAQLLAEVAAHPWPDPSERVALEARLAAVDPDRWTTPDAVLSGMAGIDAEVEAVRQALP